MTTPKPPSVAECEHNRWHIFRTSIGFNATSQDSAAVSIDTNELDTLCTLARACHLALGLEWRTIDQDKEN